MYRFLSWMAIGIAAAFLVVGTAAFSLPVIKWLAFAIGFGTLIVSGSIGFSYRQHIPTVLTGLATALVSAWTVVASLVFSEATVQNLALASGLALAGLAITGITEHELDMERALTRSAAEAVSSGPAWPPRPSPDLPARRGMPIRHPSPGGITQRSDRGLIVVHVLLAVPVAHARPSPQELVHHDPRKPFPATSSN